MKSKLLWMVILAVGSVAIYCGVVRPDVPKTPRVHRDYLEVDPTTRPAVVLPPMVVAEPRLPRDSNDQAGP